jgi:hypothetical protein
MTAWHGNHTEIKDKLAGKPIDVFICSASYESRCISVASSIDRSSVAAAVVAMNDSYREAMQSQFMQLCGLFSDKCKRLHLSSDNPIRSADHMAEVIGGLLRVDSAQRILVDITTLTRESLLMLMRFLQSNVAAGSTVEFVYNRAKEYSVGDPTRDKWLSRGIRDVRSVLGFPGELRPSRRTHLILLVGFEDERALSLIRQCEPFRVSLGLADETEPATQPHQATNVARFSRLKSILDRVEEFQFKGYDAEATAGILQEQIAKAPDLNTIIAPMNTKISTVGAASLALRDAAIQLCYAQPNTYNFPNYSAPDDDYYLFQLPAFP